MTFLTIITYIGVFVFAITGALKARANQMDLLGGLVMAFVTAYGGGTIRDLLIGIRPINWINDNTPLLLVFLGTGITFLIKDHFNRFRRTIFFTDAMGIGLFTAVGIQVAINNGINDPYAVIMGVITATFGGLTADVLSNRVPELLKRGELYATACAAGGVIYVVLHNFNVDKDINLAICVITVIGIRIFSKYKRLSLPDI